MIRLATLVLLLVPVTLRAELIVGSALRIDSSPSLGGDLAIVVGNLGGGDGDSFAFSKPNLELVTFTIGGQTGCSVSNQVIH